MRYVYFYNPTVKRWFWRIMDIGPNVQIDPTNDWKAVADKVIHNAGPYRFRRSCLKAMQLHQRQYHPDAAIERIGHPIIRGHLTIRLPITGQKM